MTQYLLRAFALPGVDVLPPLPLGETPRASNRLIFERLRTPGVLTVEIKGANGGGVSQYRFTDLPEYRALSAKDFWIGAPPKFSKLERQLIADAISNSDMDGETRIRLLDRWQGQE